MSEAWLKEQIAPDGVEKDGCHPDTAQAVEDYYHQKIESTGAAKAITAPIASSNDPGAHLYPLWNLMVDTLMQLPESQVVPSLIQLATRCDSKTTEPGPIWQNHNTRDACSWLPLGQNTMRDDWRRTLAAARWITIAGDPLYAGAFNGIESRALERRRELGEEAAVMTLVRWLFWEECMEVLRERTEQVAGAAETAVRAMKRIRWVVIDWNRNWYYFSG